MLKLNSSRLFFTLKSQAGQSSSFVIIILIVIIFAVMLAGGGASLFTGNEPSSVIESPTPTGDSATTTTPGLTVTPASGWSINVSLSYCQLGRTPYKTGAVTAEGPSDGYIKLEMNEGSNVLVSETQSFTHPKGSYSLTLGNDRGFDSHYWKVSVYSGGSSSGDDWTGGTFQKSYIGSPTGCK